MAHRDDFTKPVVLAVAQRAGYLCSNPDCRRPTSGPHSDPTKALITGEACHICAAAPGGPRYNPAQTPEQRKSIQNAIWLCAVCSDKVDKDWRPWPDTRLMEMKEQHERWIDGQGMIPALPQITLATRSGLRLVPKLSVVNQELLGFLREQELTLRNGNRVELHNLKLMMRLPEAVFTYGDPVKNAGTRLELRPHRPAWTVESVQEGGAVRHPVQAPTPNHTFDAPRVSANETIAVPIYTLPYFQVSATPDPSHPLVLGEDPDAFLPQDRRVWWYLEGSYQFLLRGEYVTNELFVPLRYSFRDRAVTSLPCESSAEGWEILPIMLFPGIHLQG